MTVKAIPDGFHTITPYLTIRGVPAVIEFLARAFDASVTFSHSLPDGSVMHAQLKIGDSTIMMGEAGQQYQPMPAMLYMYVKDVDAVYKKAIAAGGKSIKEPSDQFYGDRVGAIADSAGNQWWIATHIEDITEEELGRRAAQFKGC